MGPLPCGHLLSSFPKAARTLICTYRSASICSVHCLPLVVLTRRGLGGSGAPRFPCEDGDSNHRFVKTVCGLHPSNLGASAVHHLHGAPRHTQAGILPWFPLRHASLNILNSRMGAGSSSQIATTSSFTEVRGRKQTDAEDCTVHPAISRSISGRLSVCTCPRD